LEQFGAVRDRRLEPRGRLIAGLRHDNELLVAEGVFRGVFTDLNAAEAAAVCSALIEEARSGEAAIARDFLKKRPRLRRKLDQLESLANTIHEAQRAHHLRIPLAAHAAAKVTHQSERTLPGPTAVENWTARVMLRTGREPTFDERHQWDSQMEARVSRYLSEHPEISNSSEVSNFTYLRQVGVGMSKE